MGKSNNLTEFLTGIASTLRTKKGLPSSTKINPQDFESTINTLVYPSGTRYLTNLNAFDVKSYSSAKVSATNLTPANIRKNVSILGITGTLSEGITPTGTSYLTDTALHNVTNYASAQVSDANLIPENIALGTTILGITGTHQGGGGGSSPLPSIVDGTVTTIVDSEITTIGTMGLFKLSKLSTLNIPNCTKISAFAFPGCTSLKTLYAPNCTNLHSQACSNPFQYLSGEMPDYREFSPYEYEGPSLTSITIGLSTFSASMLNLDRYTRVTLSLPHCTTFIFDGNGLSLNNKLDLTNVTTLSADTYSPPFYTGMYTWSHYTWPTGYYAIKGNVFASASSPSTTVKATYLGNSAFAKCTSNFTLDTTQLTYIGNSALAGAKVTIPSILSTVSMIGAWAFQSCSTLPTTLTIANATLVSCPFLNVNVQSFIFSNCTFSASPFGTCSALTSVIMIDCSFTKSYQGGAYIFSTSPLRYFSCSNMTMIPSCYFGNMSKTSQFTFSLPAVQAIGASAFQDCSALTSLTLSLCESIGMFAFLGCSKLSVVKFPMCTYISSYAFSDCSKLTAMYIGLKQSKVASLAGSNIFHGTIPSIFVPMSLVSSYKSSTYWSAYSTHIYGIYGIEFNTQKFVSFASGDDAVATGGSAVCNFIVTNSNYAMPDSITVSGATYSYSRTDSSHAVVTLTNVTAQPVITIIGRNTTGWEDPEVIDTDMFLRQVYSASASGKVLSIR